MSYAAEGSVKVMLPFASSIGDTAMSDTIFPLFAPAPTVADAVRASAQQRPMHGAYITAITCARDIRTIVDTLHKHRAGALEMAADAKDAGDGYTNGVMTGHAAGLRFAIHALEAWLNGNTPAPEEPCCTECGQPAHWGRTRDGVCRQCHAEARRDPSEDTEGPEVRGY